MDLFGVVEWDWRRPIVNHDIKKNNYENQEKRQNHQSQREGY